MKLRKIFGIVFFISLVVSSSAFIAIKWFMGGNEATISDKAIKRNETASKEDVSQEEKNNEASNLTNTSAKDITEFNPTKLKYPIIINESKYDGYKEYKDADGTIYRNMTMVNPSGVMMGFRSIDEAIVGFPMDNPNNDGLTYYHGYHYYKGAYTFEVSEGTYKYVSKDAAAPYYKGYTPEKSETYNSSDMQLYDFICKFMPTQSPNKDKIVNVPLLEGKWAAYNDSLMNGSQLLASMNFSKDNNLTISQNILKANEIPGMGGYRLEYLDKNAYKLYLYPSSTNAEDNKPYKRNFIIYVTSKDTFELVYYDTKLKRNSITMKRV